MRLGPVGFVARAAGDIRFAIEIENPIPIAG